MRGGGGVPAHASLHDELGGERVGMFHRESRCLPSFILAPIVCKNRLKNGDCNAVDMRAHASSKQSFYGDL